MNPRSRFVVLDKSYLEGVSDTRIKELCIDHKVIMTFATFYEIMTTRKREDRVKCFRKFQRKTNPLSLCPNVGYLMGMEIRKKRDFSNFDDALLKINYRFNNGLLDPSFDMGSDQQRALVELKQNADEDVDEFLRRLPTVIEWFPELKKIRPGCGIDEIEPSVRSICKSSEKVRTIYAQIRDSTFPAAQLIDERWFLYRWVQVQVLAGIEFVRRHGINSKPINRENAEHTYWDLEICAVSSIAGVLASRDKNLIWYFQQVCPEGTVIQQ